MARSKKQSAKEILQQKAEEWRRETGNSSINTSEVVEWLIRKGWEPRPRDTRKLLKRELQEALREQYIEDPQGRKVRQKHPQRISVEMKDGSHEQYVLWHDIREASRPQMQAAFQQRRFGIVLDCHRLKIDVDSFNDNWNKSVPIQMEFDFTDDMADLDHDEDHMGYDEDDDS